MQSTLVRILHAPERGHCLLVFSLLTLASSAALAGEIRKSAQVENAQHAGEPNIAEVIVTARKREEAAHNVPVSLSVRSGDELERAQSQRLQEIAQTIPNLSIEVLNPRQASIAIRGIGRNPANDGLESSVGVFVDGVYLGRPGMAVGDYFDVDRIELLRGPQGALFGKNTTAGLLNITTRAPTDSFETFAHATLGNESYLQLHGAVSGPLFKAGLSGRLSALTTQREGFIHNTQHNIDLGEFNRNAVRAQLAWRSADSFDVRVIGDYSDQDEAGPGLVLVDPGVRMEDGSTRTNNFLDRSARAGYSPRFQPFERRNVGDAPQRLVSENGGVSVQARWRLGVHTLSSITAWRMWNYRPRSDSDFTPLDIQPQLHFEVADEQVSTELRVASDLGGRVDYQLGMYLFVQELSSEFVTSYGAHAADFLQPGLPASALQGFEVRTLGEPETRSGAAFGHVEWKLTERLALSAGLRWTTEVKEGEISRSSGGGTPLGPSDATLRATRDRLGGEVSVYPRLDEDFTSGLLSLSYRFGTDALAYASASRGAKSGGINVAIVPSGISQILEPEVVTSYEIGLKKRWSELSVDLVLFDMYVDDYHATVRDPVRAATFLTNAGEVRTRGFELEAFYRPNFSFELTLAGGLANARFTSFRSAACPPETVARTSCDFTGSRVPGAPPWTTNLGATYQLGLGSSGHTAYVAGNWFHAAGYQVELSSYTNIDAYDVVNLRVGVRSESKRWDAWLWARNLLDRDYYASLGAGGTFNSGVVYGLLADPRTYGASITVSY